VVQDRVDHLVGDPAGEAVVEPVAAVDVDLAAGVVGAEVPGGAAPKARSYPAREWTRTFTARRGANPVSAEACR